MKKLFLLAAVGFMLYSCDNANNRETVTDTETEVETETEYGTDNTDETTLEDGSGKDISPQLEGVEDSAARLEVNDPLNSTQESERRSE